tara:strand:- start:492 stop:689 length:198 start_codon:yes stop_codon:yes gene_type:complete
MNNSEWDQGTVLYFAKLFSDAEDAILNEMQNFVETECDINGIETYEQLTDNLYDQVKQAIKEIYE